MSSMPLFLGNLPSGPESQILRNDAAIAIDEDALRLPATIIASNATAVVLSKPLYNGDVAIALWNLSGSANPIAMNLTAIPGIHTNVVSLVDVFDQALTGATNTLGATVNAYGLNLYRVLGAPPAAVASGPTTNVISFGGALTNGTFLAPVMVDGVVASNVIWTVFMPTNPVTTNLVFWLRADAQTYADGTATNWPDSSGLGNGAQNAPGSQPVFRANMIHGLPAYSFNGSQSLVSTYIGGASTINYTLVMVYWMSNNFSQADQCLFDQGAPAGFNFYVTQSPDIRQTLDFITDVAAPQTFGSWLIGGCAYQSPYMSVFSGSVSNVLNDITQGRGYPNGDLGNGQPTIGLKHDGVYPFCGYIAEVLYYAGNMSAADMSTLITGYLQPKYLGSWPTIGIPMNASPVASQAWSSNLVAAISPSQLPVAGITPATLGAVYADNSTMIVDSSGKLSAIAGSGGAVQGSNVVGAVSSALSAGLATNAIFATKPTLTANVAAALVVLDALGQFSSADPGPVLTNLLAGSDSLNFAQLAGAASVAQLPVAGTTAAARGAVYADGSTIIVAGDGKLTSVASGGGGGASNAVTRVTVNGAVAGSGLTNLAVYGGPNIALSYTNQSPTQAVSVTFSLSGTIPFTNLPTSILTNNGTGQWNGNAATATTATNTPAGLPLASDSMVNTASNAVQTFARGVSNNVVALQGYATAISNLTLTAITGPQGPQGPVGPGFPTIWAVGWGATEAALGWNASTNATGATNYNVYWDTNWAGLYTNVLVAGTNLTVSIGGLAPATTYYFELTSVDTNGVESAKSSPMSFNDLGLTASYLALLGMLSNSIAGNAATATLASYVAGTLTNDISGTAAVASTAIRPTLSDNPMAQVLGAASNGTFSTMSPSPALVGAQPASTNLSQWAGMGTNGNVPINIAGNAATVTSVSGNSVSSDQVTTGLGFTPLANTEAAITNTLGATLWKSIAGNAATATLAANSTFPISTNSPATNSIVRWLPIVVGGTNYYIPLCNTNGS